ncbi:hypothetical protein D9M68_869570 [compost metagenome]
MQEHAKCLRERRQKLGLLRYFLHGTECFGPKIAPVASGAAHHAHGDDAVGIAERLVGKPAFGHFHQRGTLGAATRQPLVEHRDDRDHHRAGCRKQAEIKMEQEDDDQIDGEPWQIEEDDEGGAAEETTDIGEVRHRFVAGRLRAALSFDPVFKDRACQPIIDPVGDA